MRKIDCLQYKDIFTPTQGIFTAMTDTQFLENVDLTSSQVEIIMFNTCISRLIAPIAIYYLNEDEEFTSESLTQLADLIHDYFKKKWDSLAETFQIEYNPIYNYYDKHTGDDKLSENTNKTKERNYTNYSEELEYDTDDNFTPSGTRKTTRGYTNYQEDTTDEQSDTDNKVSTDNSIFGFNSTKAVPSESTETTTAYKNEGQKKISGSYDDTESFQQYEEDRKKTGTETKTFSGKYADTESGLYSDNYKNQNYNSTHMGNIGNLTTQQLLTEELEWRKNMLIKEIINDVKSFITLDIYA